MTKPLIINKKIKFFNKIIKVDGDKSLSIRWVLLASQANGKSKAFNLLMSEDVLAAIETIKKLGIKERAEIISKNKNFTKKSDIYYRLERLINKKQMGHLFKVMLIKNENNKFKLGF